MKNRSILLATLLALLTAQPGRPQVPAQLNYQGRVTVSGVNFTGTGQFRFALVDGGVNQNQTATANATVGAGQVTQIFVFNHGSGYTSAPLVTITGDGAGATATATLGLGMGTGTGPTDSVNTITINNPGSGYTTATVTIAPPPPNVLVTTFWSNDSTSIGGSAPASAVPLAVTSGLYSLALGDTALAHMTTALPASVFDNPDVRLRVWFDDGANGSQLLAPDQRFATVPYAFRAALAQSVPANSITATQLADGAVSGAKLAAGAVTLSQLNFTGSPNTNQVLGFDGANLSWVPQTGGGGGGGSLTLPYSSGAYSSSGAVFSINNVNLGSDAWGIYSHSQSSVGVFGQTHGANQSGVLGRIEAATGQGVFGYASGAARGVWGASEFGIGVLGQSSHTIGVSGLGLLDAGVYGQTYGANQAGVAGYTDAVDSTGVNGLSLQGDGMRAESRRVGYSGIYAQNNTSSGFGVYGRAGSGAVGVYGNSVGKEGVVGFSTNSHGVSGFANQPLQAGVLAVNNSANGLGLEVFGSAVVHGTATVRVLTINNGADIAEPFAIGGGEELPQGSVVVIDANHPGDLRSSEQPYDTRVAGIVSGANGVNTGLSLSQPGVNDKSGQRVALTGRVYCLADASFGAIKPGDLLTTSATPGHAMKATDHTRAQGAVLGKAMSALDEGTGYVLVLVTLQ